MRNYTPAGDVPIVRPEWFGGDRGAAFRIIEIIRALLGLSRALVGVFVVAQAGLAAVFALRAIPSVEIVVVGTVACLTGAWALIGMNDLLDLRKDRERLHDRPEEERAAEGFDLGSLFIHHPVAKGVIGVPLAMVWVMGLALVSMAATYALNPPVVLVFIVVAVFAALYCYLSSRTPLKTLAVAAAVVLGGAAGWLAVAPADWLVFPLFVLWTFLWEIGGRNVPNDFVDLREDTALGIKTVPVAYGPVAASRLVFASLVPTVVVSGTLVFAAGLPVWALAAVVLLGVSLLVEPAWKLLAQPTPAVALRLYNRSGIYPALMLVILAASVLVSGQAVPL